MTGAEPAAAPTRQALPRPLSAPRPAPRGPRRTLRGRLALLYGGLFLASGAALLLLAFGLLWTGPSTTEAPPAQAGTAVPPGPQVRNVDLHHLLAYAGIALAVMAAVSVVLGWVVANRVLRPLRTITATARDISATNLHERLSLNASYNEFTTLGQTLDDLFGRLEASFASQRHFVANASHELRTPLTAERALLQVALADPDATTESLRATCQQLLTLGGQQERLLEALLTLASSEQGLHRWEPVDLAEVTGRVLAERHDDARSRGLRVAATLAPAALTGDPSLVESLAANLLDNALRHNVTGGHVEVTTTTAGGRATIAVANTGRPIRKADVDRLFQPFQRLGAARVRHADGHGLGLAVVQAITDAHGATLTAQPGPHGGLDIHVSFPTPHSADA